MKIKKAGSLEKKDMQDTVWRKKDMSMSHVHRDWEMRCGIKEPGTDLAWVWQWSVEALTQ